jgi:hypothetical protein
MPFVNSCSYFWAIRVLSRKPLPMPISSCVFRWSYSKIFDPFLSWFLCCVWDLCVDIQFSKHHLLKRLSFLQFMFLAALSKTRCLKQCEFISGSSILVHWFTCLFLCLDHPGLFLWLFSIIWSLVLWCYDTFSIVLFAIWSLLCFHMNFRVFKFFSVKNDTGNLMRLASVDSFSSIPIFLTLILPIHEHGRSFHLLVSSSVYFFKIL